MKVYYDKDADLSLIKGKNVAIIGYGSQGHAHAQNLNDSGVKVTVGLRKGGASWVQGREGRPEGRRSGRRRQGADVVMILLPDEHIGAEVYNNDVEPNIKQGRSAGVRARLQRALRPGRAARGPRRVDGRPQGPRPHRAQRPTGRAAACRT
jgi:ketol-acid reductoisomerase